MIQLVSMLGGYSFFLLWVSFVIAIRMRKKGLKWSMGLLLMECFSFYYY